MVWETRSAPGSAPAPVFNYNVDVPGGSTAAVVLPKFGNARATVSEGGVTVWDGQKFVAGQSGIAGAAADDTEITLRVGSGHYDFTVFA